MFVCILLGAAVNKHLAARLCFCLQERRGGGIRAVFFRLLLRHNLPEVMSCTCPGTDQREHAPCRLSSFLQLQFLPEAPHLVLAKSKTLQSFLSWMKFLFYVTRVDAKAEDGSMAHPVARILSTPACAYLQGRILAASPTSFLIPPAARLKAKHNGKGSHLSDLYFSAHVGILALPVSLKKTSSATNPDVVAGIM